MLNLVLEGRGGGWYVRRCGGSDKRVHARTLELALQALDPRLGLDLRPPRPDPVAPVGHGLHPCGMRIGRDARRCVLGG